MEIEWRRGLDSGRCSRLLVVIVIVCVCAGGAERGGRKRGRDRGEERDVGGEDWSGD